VKIKGKSLCVIAACWLLWASSSRAQAGQTGAASQSGSSPKAAAQQNPSKEKTEQEKKTEKQEQSQRMLGILPQFTVTSRNDATPLTPREKFHLFLKSAFDPVEFALVGAQAGISQAENQFPDYGQGAAGYGKRYGAAFTDEVSSGFFSNFLYPAILKEDPRYFRLGQGSFKHRVGYALVQEFVCHRDQGGRSFAWSNALGALSAGSLSNAYYPERDGGFGLTMSRAGIAILYGSLGGLTSEFYPDIARKIFHKHKKEPSSTSGK